MGYNLFDKYRGELREQFRIAFEYLRLKLIQKPDDVLDRVSVCWSIVLTQILAISRYSLIELLRQQYITEVEYTKLESHGLWVDSNVGVLRFKEEYIRSDIHYALYFNDTEIDIVDPVGRSR